MARRSAVTSFALELREAEGGTTELFVWLPFDPMVETESLWEAGGLPCGTAFVLLVAACDAEGRCSMPRREPSEHVCVRPPALDLPPSNPAKVGVAPPPPAAPPSSPSRRVVVLPLSSAVVAAAMGSGRSLAAAVQTVLDGECASCGAAVRALNSRVEASVVLQNVTGRLDLRDEYGVVSYTAVLREAHARAM